MHLRRAFALVPMLGFLALEGAEPPAASAAELQRFSSCSSLVRYARANALRTHGVVGVAPQPLMPRPVDSPVAETAPTRSGGSEDSSGTNVQEAGVDEPDMVKTDGRHVFALAGDALHAVDASGATPQLLGSLDLGAPSERELLLFEGRALVLARDFDRRPLTVLTEIDVRDPRRMRVVRTLRAEGDYSTARLNGATARVVIGTAPELAVTSRRAIRAARLATWLPGASLRTAGQRRGSGRHLVHCAAIRRPRSFSGLGMVTVLTIDMRQGLPGTDADAVMADAQVVYGSPRSLYVATQRWIDPDAVTRDPSRSVSTRIHAFDAGEAPATAYRATGQVPGHLLNQFSLSEHEGLLRVASTETPTWLGTEQRESESRVTVLAADGARLVPAGSVGGLGRGERIYSVRFIDGAGYVVTFRETDPLYTLDLSVPSAPRVAGELKLPGYSAYLHPLGGGLLLGVGQAATDEGRTLGTQLSLFDVSDLARPARLHQRTLGRDSSSEAESDHHAFLYWAPTRLAVLPVDGAAPGFRLDRATGITELGRVEHDGGASIRRALVLGDRLLTVSDRGLLASRLTDLARLAWTPFPG